MKRIFRKPTNNLELAIEPAVIVPADLPLNMLFMRHASHTDVEVGDREPARESIEALGSYVLQLMPSSPELTIHTSFTKRTVETAKTAAVILREMGIKTDYNGVWRQGFAQDMNLSKEQIDRALLASQQEGQRTLFVGHDHTPESFGVNTTLDMYAQVISVEDDRIKKIAPGY